MDVSYEMAGRLDVDAIKEMYNAFKVPKKFFTLSLKTASGKRVDPCESGRGDDVARALGGLDNESVVACEIYAVYSWGQQDKHEVLISERGSSREGEQMYDVRILSPTHEGVQFVKQTLDSFLT